MGTISKPVRDKSQEKILVDALNRYGPMYRILWMLGVHTGLRISDLLNLRVADIKPQMAVREKKTGKIRTIEISAEMIDAIGAYAKRCYLNPRNMLFPGQKMGYPISRMNVWRVFRAVGAELGIAGLSPHSMRKTFATDLYAATGDISAVQRALRHKYIDTTMAYLGKRVVYVDAE
jgi:integrase